MKYTKPLWLFASALAMLQAVSANAGGRAVGNGAGRVEQNIVFAYMSLPKEIDQCLALRSDCLLSDKERSLLTEIKKIALQFPFSPDRLQFASETELPGFFDTEIGQAHRVAKTGMEPGGIVYWNSDAFYDSSTGDALLDYAFITAIWVHELGHQAGIADHKSLDALGAKLRLLLKEQLSNDIYPEQIVGGNLMALTITLINYTGVATTSDLSLFDGDHTFSLNRYLESVAVCENAADIRVGWTLNSASFQGRAHSEGNDALVKYVGWVTVRCIKEQQLLEVDRDLNLFIKLQRINGKYHFKSAALQQGSAEYK